MPLEDVVSNLQYKPLTVGELFSAHNYFQVPHYQRGYSWGSEEVKELLSDVFEAHQKFPEEAYLLGQIIVCPSENRVADFRSEIVQQDLIDGQQRCTTLYLFMLIAFEKLSKARADGEEFSQADGYLISQLELQRHIPSANSDVFYPRVKVAADGNLVIESLIAGEELQRLSGPTQKNLESAILDIRDFLEPISTKDLVSLVNFFLSRVVVVRLFLNSSAHALRVFQKVNNRGLELDAADLIKNWIFQRVASNDEFQSLAEKWNTASKNLDTARLKRVRSMEFLMKVLIGIRTGTSVPTGSLYVKWEELLKTADDARSLAQELPDAALALAAISKAHIPRTNQLTDLTTGTHLQGWIQQFEVLLAGSHLERNPYDRLLMMVEDRAMLSYWSKEPSQDFERIIHPWAHEVRKLDANATDEDLIRAAAPAREDHEELLLRANLGIRKLSYEVASQRPRIRYILARVNKSFQSRMHVAVYPMSELMKTSQGDDPGYEIDHVFPVSRDRRSNWKPSPLRDAEFGTSDRSDSLVNSIGNLILLHPNDNRSQSDALPWDPQKVVNLANSELYVNRLLVPEENWGALQQRVRELMLQAIDSVPKVINSFTKPLSKTIENWSEESVEIRAELYWQILADDIKKNLGIS
jgi:uncharacterized protein with ParB-like and HNH nuclease domain